MATIFWQRNFILDSVLEDMKERKCSVFSIFEYINNYLQTIVSVGDPPTATPPRIDQHSHTYDTTNYMQHEAG